MKARLQALRALRWNYRWRGVWAWLKGRQRCLACRGEGWLVVGWHHHPLWGQCARCEGAGAKRGYQRILSEPERVLAEQTAAAEGVFA